MPKVLYRVTLTQEERAALEALSTRGKHGSQKVLNALILLGCDEGEFQEGKQTAARLAEVLPISMEKVDRVKRRFVEHGIEVALNKRKADRQRKPLLTRENACNLSERTTLRQAPRRQN